MKYLDFLFSLEGKVAIVTGGARGNGKAIAESLLKAGASVIIIDMLKQELHRCVSAFKKQHLRATAYNCDLTNFETIKEIKQFVEKKFGRIDILVNNAGITLPEPIFTYDEQKWESTHQINLKTPFFLSQEIAKIMKKQKSGVIINITSLNSEVAFPDNPAYVSFKGGLKQLTKSLALDLGKYNIRVNNVGPGYFITKMTQKSWKNHVQRKKIRDKTILGRWGMPRDLSGLIVFLASDSSSYITGQDIYVDGGWLSKGI
ncbi:glucose 1-dehydrogenase [Candidatus Nitrosotenuis uzonensis]|uniref:2-deoxy-D-gluconate 3-dehydrogenase n=1 Tax=Candidatus Nitrosotenuis uzonensis TaxID=1407055 RepID=A0A812F2C8_9ARCH|nr:glucose 1-dehydrogenase [Candidatus Nitrosotenuis uzonensis]CAE6486987.1 2-deoxy-D-gluconate 3-dehydrogenase [Candidatus Nitrosotenuis uzonensis]